MRLALGDFGVCPNLFIVESHVITLGDEYLSQAEAILATDQNPIGSVFVRPIFLLQ